MGIVGGFLDSSVCLIEPQLQQHRLINQQNQLKEPLIIIHPLPPHNPFQHLHINPLYPIPHQIRVQLIHTSKSLNILLTLLDFLNIIDKLLC